MNGASLPKVQAVLFLCSLNSVRSPMAEAIARARHGMRLYVESAGLRKLERDPFMLAALREIGIDFAGDEARTLDEVDCTGFDLVVALSPEAGARAAALLRASAVELLHWPVEDATQAGGTREQRMEAYRRVREVLEARIRAEIAPRVGR